VVVARDAAFGHADDVFSDVRRVIGNPPEVPGRGFGGPPVAGSGD
jgi:hypothetical protein